MSSISSSVIISVLFILFFHLNLSAQIDYLSKPVTISVDSVGLDRVFDQIARQTGCYFTYDAAQINGSKPVSLHIKGQTLRSTLDTLLNDPRFNYEIVKNQVVIHPLKNINRLNSTDSILFKIYKGKIQDKETHQPLPFASIWLKSQYFGTITNEQGEFALKVPSDHSNDTLCFSYMGYYELDIQPNKFPTSGLIELSPGLVSLQEIVVRSTSPLILLNRMRETIKQNYQVKSYNYQAFYREAIKKNTRYMVYSEAILDGYKPQLSSHGSATDRVKLERGRKFTNIYKTDTLMVKLRGGLEASFQLDIIHQMPDFMTEEGEQLYNYQLLDMMVWENSLVYVIGFKQKSSIPDALLSGQMYISVDDYTLLGADFQFSPERIKYQGNRFVLRKSTKLRVRPVETHYQVSYIKWQGKYYTRHVRGELVIKVNSRQKLFTETYSTLLEMAYTGYDTLNVLKPVHSDMIQTNTIFSDNEFAYDESFWGDQNIIQPEENILDALKKSGLKMQEQVDEPGN